ncbi:MAG: hypothetical protein A2268_01995 [Candidatus Raymondbacteria bacterium RifOxyA12_full_50_37]|uniref:non-specific serine/threonine protein kinase n=1 Tax=Candidatus Raymondbacteria bacterium RIFOXYD12_FULL_49_13 TaxID=1817890 RepID=A0A1F7F5U1_UNCRA|nr:MAG: hypothetical protein A2268_01995 [Candidatus Raymondbacteria bacterium RifOxyA12_full_50_37]OGJ92115.1 MAG: hypothetical protein A2248_10825 [Candidatus Raymondbacteria bacterium RIFOXYA2_FULL_49_16]OGJ93479.1 MAG: hypothetical protein A2487_20670 [Candidatus Raymondbacteria bacterium RifOxyC12_full_50_8]OGJ98471.1 MAG: hypothetical protein A2453_07065 [Candidatus Raymondbacteria bacterium RIFOXYC2_FULL_50_21]OGK02025.1 MAG: hypothetical protein A2519_17590 [Candidatus Raymondbacteria b
MESLIGKTIGNHRIVREIGSGATATVYLCHHVSIDRKAAIKVLHSHLLADSKSLERFRREAQAIASLNHENIVRIYDFVVEKGNSYIIFEYIEGTTLKERLAEEKDFPPELAVPIAFEVCRALKAAHDVNIIHRDVKPENILLTRDGRVKLTDFGIARFLEMDGMTLTGALMGSPNYMSPEQVEGGEVGRTADIFSVGVLLYYMMTREHPFSGPSHAKIIRNIMTGSYTPAETANRRVNLLASRVVDTCLRKDPAERYGSAEKLLQALASLNECFGFSDPAEELRRFFSMERMAYLKGFAGSLSAALLKQAHSDLAKKNTARALALLNHLLCLNPADREALRLYKRMSRKRSLKFFAGIGLCVFLLAAGLFFVLHRDTPNPLQAPPSVSVPLPDTMLATSDSVEESPPLSTQEPVVSKTARLMAALMPKKQDTVIVQAISVKSEVGRFGTFKLFTKPWAKIYIDGEYKGNTPFLGTVIVSAGKHAVRLVNPFCTAFEDSIMIAGDSVTEKRYELREK